MVNLGGDKRVRALIASFNKSEEVNMSDMTMVLKRSTI